MNDGVPDEPRTETWGYRVMRHTEEPPAYFAVHEVHYDGDGNVRGWTQNPAVLLSEDSDGLRWTLERVREALDRPALDFETGAEVPT
jgi:hypothetical protein